MADIYVKMPRKIKKAAFGNSTRYNKFNPQPNSTAYAIGVWYGDYLERRKIGYQPNKPITYHRLFHLKKGRKAFPMVHGYTSVL